MKTVKVRSIDRVPASSLSRDVKLAKPYESIRSMFRRYYILMSFIILLLFYQRKKQKLQLFTRSKWKYASAVYYRQTLKSTYTRWKILRCKVIGSNSYRIVFLNEFQISNFNEKFASYIAYFFFFFFLFRMSVYIRFSMFGQCYSPT